MPKSWSNKKINELAFNQRQKLPKINQSKQKKWRVLIATTSQQRDHTTMTI